MNRFFALLRRILGGAPDPVDSTSSGLLVAPTGSSRRLGVSAPPPARRPRGLVTESDLRWAPPAERRRRTAPVSAAPASEPPRPSEPLAPERGGPSFVLTVDDAGQFYVACGARLRLGHLRAGRAELLFLADVGSLHAELIRTDSLRHGPVWRIEPLGAELVTVDGAAVGPAGLRLGDGDTVRCGQNLSFVFRVPDPASHTVLLDLQHGVECAGALHVVLFGEGEGGRLRVGAAAQRHVRVPNLSREIELQREGQRILVRCAEGVRADQQAAGESFSLPCPPPERVHLSFGTAQDGRPPFGFSLEPPEPLERPERHETPAEHDVP